MNQDLIPAAPSVAGDIAAGSAGAISTLTYAAVPGRKHVISAVYWSYDAAPTGGAISIEDVAGTTVFGPFAISGAGPGWLPIYPAIVSQVVNTAMLVKLAAPGGAVQGRVQARHFLQGDPAP